MPANVETMFYVGEAPWHRLGAPLPDIVSWQEAIKAARLDWHVGLFPVYAHGETGATSAAEGYKAVVRLTSGHRVLGIVSDKYTPVQNEEAFRFLDDVADAGLLYETAGALSHGETVWALARLPKDAMIADADAVRFYLLLSNSHNGTAPLRVAVTPVRVVCQNTLTMALRSAVRTWAARHVGDPTSRFAEARRTIDLSYEYAGKFEKVANDLCAYRLMDSEMEQILQAVWPAEHGKRSPRAEKKVEMFRAVYAQGADLAPYRGTAWAAYNALAAFNDHMTRYRTPERRFLRAAVEEGTVKDAGLEAIKRIVYGTPDRAA